MPSPTQHNPTQLTNLYCYTYHSQPARRGSRHVDALPCVPEPIPTTRTEWGGPQTLALKLKRTASHSLPHVWHSHLPHKQTKAFISHVSTVLYWFYVRYLSYIRAHCFRPLCALIPLHSSISKTVAVYLRNAFPIGPY
jgi:hypothetical protein